MWAGKVAVMKILGWLSPWAPVKWEAKQTNKQKPALSHISSPNVIKEQVTEHSNTVEQTNEWRLNKWKQIVENN